ncbi:MAG: Omp28 family outer membrane lipoprotein [Candidatus Kapaibacterium sp.]
MRTGFIKYIALMITAIGIYSCDEINPPYYDQVTPGHIDTTDKVQNILFEEFTGFRCGNCPEASDYAHELQELYSEGRIIIINIHATSLARPHPGSIFDYEFRTAVGNDISSQFGIQFTPVAMINRQDAGSGGAKYLLSGNWAPAISDLIDNEPGLSISIDPEYNESKREITAEVSMNYFNQGSENHYLCVYIVEDNVIAAQQDDRNKANPIIEEYEHNNVLRGSMNGTWGEEVSLETIEEGDELKKTISYTIPADLDWKPDDLKLVAFVYNNNTNDMHILQAESVKLKE